MRQLLIIVTVGMLISAGATAGLGGQPKSLHEAAASGDVEQLKHHIAGGADLNVPNENGVTPLLSAVESNRIEAVKVMLEAGANPNMGDRDGVSPLIAAALRGQPECVEALLAKGADASLRDNFQRTALHAAVLAGRKEIVEALVQAGADVNAQNGYRQTPLAVAMEMNRSEIVAYLRQQGASAGGPVAMPGAPYGNAATPYPPTAYMEGPGAYGPPPAAVVQIDPNVVRAQMKEVEGLAAVLQALEQKNEGEQRGWVQRRSDNRASLLTLAQKQFDEELALVKGTAGQEKAAKTAKAVDDLTATRKKRGELIATALRDQLREQRREALQSTTDTSGRGRGRTPVRTGRAGPGEMGPTGSMGMDPYSANAAGGPMVMHRPGPGEANEPALDPQTQEQMQAWLTTSAGDKKGLLDAVHRQDLVDLSALQEIALEEQAKKTTVTIMALMMVRQERVAKVVQKWREDDERMQKLQQRYGQPGATGTPQDQTGTRRPPRRR